MDRLDERLRVMAEGETLPLPEAYEAAMDGLEEQVRRGALGETVRRRPVRRRALLAAAIGIIACGVCAAAAGRMGWLSPVVDYGDSEALMEEISVRVDQTAEGDHCDLTLESAVTDGRVIYCLFTGRYDEAFPDVDAVVKAAAPAERPARGFRRGLCLALLYTKSPPVSSTFYKFQR